MENQNLESVGDRKSTKLESIINSIKYDLKVRKNLQNELEEILLKIGYLPESIPSDSNDTTTSESTINLIDELEQIKDEQQILNESLFDLKIYLYKII